MSYTIRRLEKILEITGASSYLEIGVYEGQTFNAVAAPIKDAVDPKFRFDVDTYSADGVGFYETTSNEFILKHVGSKEYDVIYIDGLHTFEQSFRDFCMTLTCSHKNTVWIIDDVYPLDIFSSDRNCRRAMSERAKFGSERKEWHGDVYKTVFAIHDFFPNFDYRSISSGGNQQTVLIQRPREEYRTLFDNLESISRLDYYGFISNLDVLKLSSEETVMRWLRQAIGKFG